MEEGRNGETKRGRGREKVEKRKEWEEIDGGERRDRLSLHTHVIHFQASTVSTPTNSAFTLLQRAGCHVPLVNTW